MEVYKVAAGGVTNGLTFEFDVDCTPKVTEAPVAKAESTGESTILLKWDAVAGAETYNVYRGTETVATGIAETYYTVTGLNPETEYCFTVTTVNEAGESEASEAVCATTYTAGVKIVQIGNGETKESYAPISNYGNAAYSISQQLYLKDEINSEPCAINALSFQNATGAQGTRNIIVYMTNTNKETYASTQDWATVSDSDIVYQGEHTFGANEEWTTIELQTPFIYRGKNVCVTVNDITGVAAGYQGADSFYGTVVDVARGLYKTSSQEQIDCSDLNSTSSYFLRDYNYSTYNYYFYVANVKMRTEAAEVEEIPVPNAPASLVAETINFSSISLTWEAAEYAESYNLYSGTDTIAIGLTETSYTVSRLNPETEYCFTVTAVNLEGESEASVEDCATTDVFEGCFVDFEMNDSYGDGWNGNYLLVSYGDVSERLDLGNGATVTHTLPLPKDVDITVTFVIPEGINTYPGENSFVVRYENGDEIVNTGLLSNAGYEFTFVANCDGTDTPDEPVVPTEIVTVEVNSISGQNAQMHSNYYLPAHTYEAYSISQQIYTNEDLGYDAGYVHSVSFKVGAYGEAVTRSYEVYMKNIEESEFVQTDDAYNYFAVSAEDKVFDGEVTTSGNDEWYTVDFTTSFNYTGANVLLCVYDKTGTSTENPFGYYSVNVMRRGLSSAGSEAYDATALTTGTIRHYVNQVQFEIGPEALTPVEPTLAAPTNLVATRGLYSVMLTWDAVEGAEYYVIYKDGQEWGSSNGTTYTEGNLVAETEYCFEVVAVDADNVYGEKSETLCTTTYELAENEILIGEKSTSYYSPFLANLKNYGGGWFEAIYKAEEIGQAGTISEIAFSYEQGLEDIADINIYLAETSRTAFESNDWTAESELELVYSGTGVVLSDNPFETFVLDTPFEYTGENNLLVVVTTLAENGKSIKWDCYYDANSVLLAIGYPTPTMQYGTDNNKPVMKLTLGEGGNDTPVEPVAPEYFLTSVTYPEASNWKNVSYVYEENTNKLLRADIGVDQGYGMYSEIYEYNDNGQVEGYTHAWVANNEIDYNSEYTVVDYIYTDGVLTSYTDTKYYTYMDPSTVVYTFSYNADGTVAERVNALEGSENPSGKHVYTYENGRLVKKDTYYYDAWSETPGYVLEYECEYAYDENGNCVSETQYSTSYEGERQAREVVEYTYNTEVAAEKAFVFAYPGTVAPAHVNVITKTLSYRFQENWETGEAEKVDESVATYNYTPQLPGTPVEPEPVAPEAPYVYASGISESEIELGWYYWYGAPEGLVGYNVYQVEGETYTLLADSVATESYIVEGLAAETEYAFAVTALANGLESEYSEVAYAETYATEPDAVVPVADYYRVASKMNLAYGYLSGTTYKYLSDSTDVVTEIVDEQLGQTSKLIYNENGQLTGYVNVYEDWETGEPVEDTAGVTYAYNEQGLLASCTETYYDYWTYQYVTTTDSYTYNEQGQLVEFVSESMGTVSEFAYNEDATLATRTDYYVYEDETTGESSKELNLKYVYVYETGKLVKVNYYYDDVTEGEAEAYEEFEYDEKGNCVKATSYEYGDPNLIVEYEYNTEVAAEKVTPCFEFPQYVLEFSNFVYVDYAHQPSSVNILTKERVTRCYPDYETGELVSYPDGVTIYNYEGWIKPSDGPVNPEPTVPAAPEVYAFADNGAVILVWNPVPTATKYAVYQGEDKLGELTDTIVGVNVMGPGEYCFTVTAFNEIGESEHSNLACATVEIPEDTEKPAAPVLTATIENNKIVLSWNAVEGATYYSVYNEGQLLGYIQETTVSLDLPQEYGTYCFTVTASNIAGESEHSNVACVVYGDGIAENEATLNVYPNPVENMLFIETESYIEEVSIYTITGTMIYSEVDFNSNSIDVSDFNGGVYIMKVRTENGEIVKRFIKK